jgi:DNA polymerase-3 subunit beta
MAAAMDLSIGTNTLDAEVHVRALKRALGQLVKVAPRKSAHPILESILVRAEGTRLVLTATDLMNSHTIAIPADVRMEGSMTLPAATFAKAVPTTRDAVTLRIRPVGSSVVLSAQCGLATTIAAGSADDFPTIPSAPAVASWTIGRDTLRTLLHQCSAVMSTDDTRPHLAAMLFRFQADELTTVATDGHRLHAAQRGCPGRTGLDGDILVRSSAVHALARMVFDRRAAREVMIAKSGDTIAFWTRDSEAGLEETLVSRIVDAAFPAFAQVIPQRQPTRLEFDRAATIPLLIPIARDGRGVRLAITTPDGGDTDLLSLTSTGGDTESTVQIPVKVFGQLPAQRGVSAKYLVDALQAHSDAAVRMHLDGALDPIKFTDGCDGACVVMPMRI